MKRFLTLISLYFFLLIGLLLISLIISSNIVKNRQFKNYETESNLLVMNNDEKFDILFMGISHARNFSRHKNHLRIEDILDKKIINIGQGGGHCGINEQLFYLDYFYNLGNTCSTVVYIISPPLFFSETLPIASNTFDSEPFELKFFIDYLFFKTENKQERLTSYLRTKLTRAWYYYKPTTLESMDEQLNVIDSNAVASGQQLVYNDSLGFHRFNKSIERVEETIQLALKNYSNVILVIPPVLFGKWEGHYNVENFAKKMQKIYGVEYYDFSMSVLSPEYYYDHHHLNTNGVVYFTNNYLKPILHMGNKARTHNIGYKILRII
jgi:hypothetical protein